MNKQSLIIEHEIVNPILRVLGSTPIYWINLNSSIDRRKNMEKQLNNCLQYRIEAIDGRDEKKFDETYTVLNPNPNWSSGLTAVICSHIKAIKQAFDNNLSHAIIVEDRCQFDCAQYYQHTIDEILKLANKNQGWDIIQLHTIPIYTDFNDYIKNGIQIIKRDMNFSGCYYLINKTGMEKILNLIPYDGVKTFNFTNIRLSSDPESVLYSYINAYILNCPFFYCNSFETTFPYYDKHQNKYLKEEAGKYQVDIKNKIINFFQKTSKAI